MLGLREITFALAVLTAKLLASFASAGHPMNGTHWRPGWCLEKVLDDVGLAFGIDATACKMRCADALCFDHERRWRPGCGRGTNFAGFNRPGNTRTHPRHRSIRSPGCCMASTGRKVKSFVRTSLWLRGYTDVIGFHRSGVPTAVATCGTAFTEEHEVVEAPHLACRARI